MEKQKRLFLKQKDYQMTKFKSQVQFNQSIHDPLINPSAKARRKQNRGITKGNLFDNNEKLSIEQRNKRKLTKNINPLLANVKQDKQNINKVTNQKIGQQGLRVQTPWAKILSSFTKNYDFMKQPMDLQIANPFGSYGLKIQDQLKGMAVRQSKIKMDEKMKQGQERTTISIRAYLKAIQLMKKQLEKKWAEQDKVACLQIAIQACKLLHDSSNTKFHALKFAYVIEIIDRFGILVFQRIKKLSFPHLNSDKLQEINIKSLEESNIPQNAQEICRNWLLKIASIRQLIPRTIIQTTLLRLHFFINNGVKGRPAFQRLYKSNRCFGQVMNVSYFLKFNSVSFLELSQLEWENKFFHQIKIIFQNQQRTYFSTQSKAVLFYSYQGLKQRDDVSNDQLFEIVQPFFITSFENLAQNLEKEKFKKFMNMILTINPHYVIIKNLVQTFSPTLLTAYAVDIVKMIQKTSQVKKYQLYKYLLNQIRSMTFNQSGQFIVLLWTDINQINDIQILLQILGPFSEIIFRNLPSYQKNKFYGLILDKFSGMFQNFNSRALNKNKLAKFENFLSQMIQRTGDLKDIVTLEPFLQLISYFPQKSKQQISFNIVKTFVSSKNDLKIKDPVVVHIMLSLTKNLSGFKGQKGGSERQIEDLIMKFVDRVQFQGKQLQQFLTFYSQIRASFGYLQKVTTSIIYKAAGLTYKARNLAKGKITNKLISFLQAAVAFCYITVPVLQRPEIKLKLYVYLCQVALTNNLISQSTSFIKTCITQLSQIQLKTDVQLYQIFFRIINFMIVIPDDPEKDFLFLFNGLFQAFQVSKFKSNFQNIVKYLFYTNCITYLSCQAQQKLPFHIDGVTSNDGLYKSQEFKQTLIQKIYEIFDKIQKTVDKIQKGPTADTLLDTYIVSNMPQSILTLTDIFDGSERIKSLLVKLAKLLSGVKDRALRKQTNPVNIQKIKRMIDGVNQKLKESGYGNIKIL